MYYFVSVSFLNNHLLKIQSDLDLIILHLTISLDLTIFS